MKQLQVPAAGSNAVLMPPDTTKEQRYRLGKFIGFLARNNRSWIDPDLVQYRDYLREEGYADTSIDTMIGAVRGRYREILRDREALQKLLFSSVQDVEQRAKQQELIVNHILGAIHPDAAPLLVQRQAKTDYYVLTTEQISALINMPGKAVLMDYRDRAQLALMLYTGIRESEVIRLDEEDFLSESEISIKPSKGRQGRWVPYLYRQMPKEVAEWLKHPLRQGRVFPGFYRGGDTMRSTNMSLRSVRKVFERYPLLIDGEEVIINSTDCRATYAWQMFRTRHEIGAIAEYMGSSEEQVRAFITEAKLEPDWSPLDW